jgi:hypothetical protein
LILKVINNIVETDHGHEIHQGHHDPWDVMVLGGCIVLHIALPPKWRAWLVNVRFYQPSETGIMQMPILDPVVYFDNLSCARWLSSQYISAQFPLDFTGIIKHFQNFFQLRKDDS